MRYFKVALLLIFVLGIGGLGLGWYLAGREAGPTITLTSPEKSVGQASTLALTADGGATMLTRLDASLEQNGQVMPIYSLGAPATANPVSVSQAFGKKTQPALVNGKATLAVTAVRPVFFGLRTATTTVTRELQVRLDPPRVAVVSIHHFVNLGGAEFAVLKVSPDDVQAGVRVGDASYPAYPGTAAGLTDPSMRVVFFALRYDQPTSAPMVAFAKDAAGNEATTALEHQAFPKVFLKSRIPIDQAFLERVVPAIASNTPDLKIDTASTDGLLKGFLTINGDLRKKNAETILGLAGSSKAEMLWKDAFVQMGNSQVESRFADQRTYFFDNKEIDHQVHLGFDLATVQHAPVHAANRGVVVFAAFLGIYGNCVILDHGLGVQSLYAHMSSIGVKPGDAVDKGQELGRTGSTGLAGGDHLHFTMLLQGTPVNSVEWWDPHWMEDRVWRKVREAGGPVPEAAATPAPAAKQAPVRRGAKRRR